MSAFLATIFLGGGGGVVAGGDDEWTQSQSKHCHKKQSPTQKLLGRVFSHSPKFFCFPSIVVVVVVLIRNLKSAETQGHPTRNFEKQS